MEWFCRKGLHLEAGGMLSVNIVIHTAAITAEGKFLYRKQGCGEPFQLFLTCNYTRYDLTHHDMLESVLLCNCCHPEFYFGGI